MAAPFSLILRKCEKACAALLATKTIKYNNVLVPIYQGKNSTDKAAPCIIVWAERAVPAVDYSGNSAVTIHTMVKVPLVDLTIDASDTLTATVFDTLLPGLPGDQTTLADNLNAQAIPDFTAMSSRKLSEEANIEADISDLWVETLSQELICAAVSGL